MCTRWTRANSFPEYVIVKFIYSEKATKFCEIFTLLLTTVHTVKSKVKISQNFVALSEYMNFNHFKGLSYDRNNFATQFCRLDGIFGTRHYPIKLIVWHYRRLLQKWWKQRYKSRTNKKMWRKQLKRRKIIEKSH